MTGFNQNQSADFWRGQRVLVTGATGMIGSWLVKELLALGASVLVLVRDADPQSELIRSDDVRKTMVIQGSLEDFWTLERAINANEIETVFHLGAQTIVGTAHRFPLPTFEANIRGTYNLLEACRLHNDLVKRVIVASSDKAYGDQKNLPYVEEMPLNANHPYDVSKACADLIAQSYFHSFNLPVAIARCGNIYGGGDLNWSRIVPGTIRAFFNGVRPIIRSDGTFVRDYIYVKDICRAYLRLGECLADQNVQGEAFNFSSGQPFTVIEMVDAIKSQFEKISIEPDIRNVAEGEIRSQYLSAAKAQRLLRWKPTYSLEQGLRETIEWYRVFLGR
jgi:CDP-glucose 4,6-dehydratase